MTVCAEASMAIDAAPSQVYELLADYEVSHPQILPHNFFTGIHVVSGGHGAGTVLDVGTRQFGRQVIYRTVVTEPEPGRVLVESDQQGSFVTTFTVDAADSGGSLVRIATEWKDLRGLLSRWLTPIAARAIYQRQLEMIASKVRRGTA
ncbi:MAG TPA: SRPBCC family protein [Fimbriimonadaceae bacterium]|nr:SRPBCC family protein [Fimbriimonadaceae bacterium]